MPRRSQLKAIRTLHWIIDQQSEIALGRQIATCKSGLSRGKMAQIETSDYSSSQKEKKIGNAP